MATEEVLRLYNLLIVGLRHSWTRNNSIFVSFQVSIATILCSVDDLSNRFNWWFFRSSIFGFWNNFVNVIFSQWHVPSRCIPNNIFYPICWQNRIDRNVISLWQQNVICADRNYKSICNSFRQTPNAYFSPFYINETFWRTMFISFAFIFLSLPSKCFDYIIRDYRIYVQKRFCIISLSRRIHSSLFDVAVAAVVVCPIRPLWPTIWPICPVQSCHPWFVFDRKVRHDSSHHLLLPTSSVDSGRWHTWCKRRSDSSTSSVDWKLWCKIGENL